MNLSHWESEVFFKDIQVAIIGSGIVGLNAAISVKEKHPNWRVVVFERGSIPSGASTKNAGFACFGSVTELLSDLKVRTEDQVFALVEDRWRGLALMRERLGDQNIGFKSFGGYELFSQNDESIFKESLAQVSFINRALKNITGYEETFIQNDQNIEKLGLGNIDHLIFNQAEGQIHTGKMMFSLIQLAKEKGVEIYNGLGLKELEDQKDHVVLKFENNWVVKSQKTLIATNGFAKQLYPEIQSKPARNQVIITKPILGLSLKGTFHYQAGYWYFRNVGDRVLLGGGRHLDLSGEETSIFGFTDLIQNEQMKLLNEVILPNYTWEIDSKWSGIMGVGDHKKPIIQQVSSNVVAAVRLGGMGVAIGAFVGFESAGMLMDN